MAAGRNPVVRTLLGDEAIVTMAASALVVSVLGIVATLPSIGTPLAGRLDLWMFLPTVVPAMLALGLDGALPTIERISARGALTPVSSRLVAGLGCVLVATAGAAAGAPDGIPGAGFVAWRNAAFVAGLALTAAALIPSAFALAIPFGYVLVSAAVGVPASGVRPWWSLLPQRESASWATVVALAALLAGIVLTLVRAQKRTVKPG